jgi:hypothetical protein
MRWSWVAGASAILAGYAAIMFGCASMDQKQSDVYRREAGGKLEPWKTVHEASEIHWPYAWSAAAAYQDSDDPKRRPLETSSTCPEPHAFLTQRGWVQWMELPSLKPRAGGMYADAAQAMQDVHLRVEVWSNATTRQVVVAFGGTAGSSLDDWKSNLRWALAFFDPKDEYTVLTDIFVPTFAHEYQRREGEPAWAWLKDARVISVGHSLGGGLAQRFAYSLQTKSGIPTVKEVYAFDPSPVSGKRSSPDFVDQARGLTIYRIYNRGEILASLRSLVRFGNPGDRRNQGQTWVDIRYRDNWTWKTLLPSGSVHAHSMYDLARFMAKNLPPADMPVCLDPADN